MEPESDVVITHQSITSVSTTDETIMFATAEVLSVELTEDKHGKGKPLSKMYNLFHSECKELLKIEPGRTHTVLFKVKLGILETW